MADKTVPLSRQYQSHDLVFKEIVLREPKLKDHMELGEPIEAQRGPNGPIVIEHFDVISKYIDRLVKAPGAEHVMDLDLVDSLAVKNAVTSFFTEAAVRLAPKKPGAPQTSSSGAPDKASLKSSS